MKSRLIPALLMGLEQEGHPNQPISTYKVWTNTTIGNWNSNSNWSSNLQPSGGENVLFGPYQGVCEINVDTPPLNNLFVRSDHDGLIVIKTVQDINVQKYFTYNSDGVMSFNRSVVTINSGDLRMDGNGNARVENAIFNLSGNADIRRLQVTDQHSVINMLGNNKYVYSDATLNQLNIFSGTIVSGNLFLAGDLRVSGTLDIPTGSIVTLNGDLADLYSYTNSQILGKGDLILEDEASIVRADGFIGPERTIIQNNNVGQVLPTNKYNIRKLIIRNTTDANNSFVFGTGTYVFDSNVIFESIGSGDLEIDTRFHNPTIYFNKDFALRSGEFSTLRWVSGNGDIYFGKPTSIAREFNSYRDGRGGVNTLDESRGLVASRSGILNEEPILWILEEDNTVPIRIINLSTQGHSLGNYVLTSSVGSGLGDISIGQTPAFLQKIYVGDIADPNATRSAIRVFRFTEPEITGVQFGSTSTYENILIRYPSTPTGEGGGIARDCRAMFVDYGTSDIYFISHKTIPPQLFRLVGSISYVGSQLLTYLGNVNIPSGQIVGADLSRDGTELLVKTWEKVYYWNVTGTISGALINQSPTQILDYQPDYLDHGIAWGSGTNSFYTVSHFNSAIHDSITRSPLYHYNKKHLIDTNSISIEDVFVNADRHIKELSSDLITSSFSLESGIFNVSGNNITTLQNFYVGPGGNFNRRGWNNSTIDVHNNFLVVGTTGNIIKMHPDSGDGGWILHVSGEARAYYTSARASNAASGSTIYAYFSQNFGSNTNWSFLDTGTTSGFLCLYTTGTSPDLVGSFLPVYTIGKQGNLSGSLDLFLSGTPSQSVSNLLYLYLSGTYQGIATGGIPLYLANSGVEGSLPLYTRGSGITSGAIPLNSVLYLYLGQSGMESGMPLYTVGHSPTTGGIPLYLVGATTITGGMPLFTTGIGIIDLNNNALRIYTHARHSPDGEF